MISKYRERFLHLTPAKILITAFLLIANSSLLWTGKIFPAMGGVIFWMTLFLGANGAVDDNNLNTDVNFKVVQRRESRVVVVMDVSGSMVCL